MIKRASFSCLILFISINFCFAWGQTGHRVVGEIAWSHLNKKAQKNIIKVLGTESLAMSGNYMDFIKSDKKYNSYNPWHYCTLKNTDHYDSTMTPEEGDVVYGINKFTQELKTKEYSVDEAFALKCLVHLIGDIHQPLHCGNGNDRGGNDVKVEFFYENSNLHRVWDSGIIDNQQLSFTEYSQWINHATKDQIAKWQSSSVNIWANESKAEHKQIYNFPENKKLSYRYVYDNIELLNKRLLMAGIRLAGVLNQIYG